MSVRLFLRCNETGKIHEYGTDPHDSLVLNDDGSLHYVHLQSCTGTRFPEEGYTFVTSEGIDPREDEDLINHGCEPYIDIGGER